MKNIKTYLVFISLLLFGNINAQLFEDLKSPSMPSASIIGTQINEITRPKSMKALETALLNNFVGPNNNLLIPNNYAFEVTPYMLSKRKNFNYLSYLNDSVWNNVKRNFSFSVASTNDYVINDSITSNALGFGIRTIILNGQPDEKLAASYKKMLMHYDGLRNIESNVISLIDAYLDAENKPYNIDSIAAFIVIQKKFKSKDTAAIITEIFKLIPDTTSEKSITNAFSDLLKKTLSLHKLIELRKLIDKVKTERYGWRLEVDAALALSFPTNEFDYSFTPKQALWFNLSWRIPKKTEDKGKLYKGPSNWELVLLGRWINNDESFINKYNPIDTLEFKPGEVYDFGLRTVFETGKFSAEIEYIYRLNKNTETITVNGNNYSRTINDDTYKLLLNINYNLTDNIVFSYNIGQNFDSPGLTGRNLISGFSLNFGFGAVKVEDLVKEGMKDVK
jgi:hypothetical protein